MKSFRSMPLLRLFTVSLVAAILALAVNSAVSAYEYTTEEADKLLAPVIGNFKVLPHSGAFKGKGAADFLDNASGDRARRFSLVSETVRVYRAKNGEALLVSLFLTQSDAHAFSLFTNIGCPSDGGARSSSLPGLETSSCTSPATVRFAKGPVYVVLGPQSGSHVSPDTLISFASLFEKTLDKGEGDIPALVKHLPGWENGGLHALLAVNAAILNDNVPNQPILEAFSFDGGVEAASAHYGNSQLVIVEFNTPQLATDNNAKIVARIQELRSQGRPTPTGYRRVGNYAVFVFDAADEATANQLIDQVKYQQVVQWLGENPFAYEAATREFTETTLGVLVAVVKTSGLALVACLGLGGLLGALLFRARRSQQRAREAYADSDAMLRLNLDELTSESDRRRLIGREQ